MPTCCVPYCSNASNKNSEITFHEFPHETPLFLKTWLEKIGRPCWRPGHRSVVCSQHFVKTDFHRNGKLRLGSFPSVFPKLTARKKKLKTDASHQDDDLIPDKHAPSKEDNAPSNKYIYKKIYILPNSHNVKIEAGNSLEPGIALKAEQFETETAPSKGIHSVSLHECTEDNAVRSRGSPSALEEAFANPSDLNCNNVDYLKAVVSPQSISNLQPDTQPETQPIPQSNFQPEIQPIPLSDSQTATQLTHQCDNQPETQPILQLDPQPEPQSESHSAPESENNAQKTVQSSILKRKGDDATLTQSTKITKTAALSSIASTFSLVSCRVCGHTSNLNIPIFGQECLKDDLAGLINKYLPIKVAQTDSLPLNICHVCVSRLKECQALVESCGRTDDVLRGRAASLPEHNTDTCTRPTSETNVQHVKFLPKHPILTDFRDELATNKQKSEALRSGLSRILLLEMPCQDQVPVKTMVNQAVEELTLRLQPKDTRKCKPFGRIMFLDLQGSRAAYPEQISKAVAMMFGNGSTEAAKKKVIASTSAETLPEGQATSKTTQPLITSPASAYVRVVPTTGPITASTKVCLSQGSTVAPTLPTPTAIQMAPLNSASAPIPLTCPTLPQSMPSLVPPSNVNTILTLPPGQSFPNLIQLPPESVPLQIQAQFTKGVDSASSSFPCLVPLSVSNVKTIPPKVVIEAQENQEPKSVERSTKLPVDITSMREKVLTKINNTGKQFKLGDKIVGIVLRNSESSEEIQKKLQATFSKPAIVSKSNGKPKERPIAPKGGEVYIETSVVTDLIENVKKPRAPTIDICSSPDNFCSFNERRPPHKPTLGFMWQKTAYLASSYQKLFTWVPPFGAGTMPVLSCRVCCRTVSNKFEVENHLQGHPDLQCTVCQKYFLTVDKVHEHAQVIHRIAPADMPKKKTYISWRNNTLRVPVWKYFQCSRCEKRYKQKEALERHTIVCKQKTLAEKVIAISNANLLACPVCNKKMATNAALQEHMLVHAKRTSWLCDICGQVLRSPSNYRSHTARHEEFAHHFKYQCKVCKKRFKLLNRFIEHEKSHEVQQQFICPSCGKVFRTLNGLRQHEILHGERKLQCRFCPSRFHRRDHLRIHEASHNKPPNQSRVPRNFRCRFCPASEETARFPNMRQLMDHYTQAHDLERGKIPGSQKYSCDRCPRTFVNSTLLRHHFMWHDGERPYHCSICGEGFMVKERLRNHENKHLNQRPHKCPLCGKGFRSRHVLKQHKKVHSDPSTHYKCQYCPKLFSRIDNLRTHELVHTGVKPWKCIICLRQFRIRADCAKHISTTHQLSPADVQLSIENVAEESSSIQESALNPVKTITSVDSIEFLLEDDDIIEEEENAIE